MDRFTGRVAAITGAASGIGRAIALRFAADGGSVVVADLNATTGAETVALAAMAGHTRVRFVRTDVAEEASIERMIAETVATFGRLDCLVNNAGIGGAYGSVMNTTVEDWDQTFAVLARGVFLGIKHGARAMVEAGIEGSIINIASVAGMSGGDAPIAYASAKAAVINMTKGAAVELAQYRIRVNCVCPGAIRTPLLERGLPADPAPVLETLQPWPDSGCPEDLAGAALFLASDDARFVTGTTLVVDGGRLLKSNGGGGP
jgi:NAD(P)-dependent dehydrogenase (short-subunit alcohol dehydrogenase family)